MSGTAAAYPTIKLCDSADGQYGLGFPQEVGKVQGACGDAVNLVYSLVVVDVDVLASLVDVPAVLLEMS
jgi:hypothetical protein